MTSRMLWLIALFLGIHGAGMPSVGGGPRHYVFFGMDRERIREVAFLHTTALEGAQLKYTWRELEPEAGEYDFDSIRADLAFLSAHGKQLFIQLQDVSFDAGKALVPRYVQESRRYRGGAAQQYRFEDETDTKAIPDGWVARRWEPAVRRRFQRLLAALGRAFDGRIAGLNLPETAVDFGSTGRWYPEGFTPARYRDAVLDTMEVLRRAFPKSVTLQYANFMPGEWLPGDDRGYLKSVYQRAWKLGVGVGGPDLLPYRPAQQRHLFPLLRLSAGRVPTGVAIQDGNLAMRNLDTGRAVTAVELLEFATTDLRVEFLFWGTEEPYFSSQVIPMLRALPSPR